MNDITAIKLLSNFMKRVNVTGVEEAQALIEVSRWLNEKEKQIVNAMNNGQQMDNEQAKQAKTKEK